MRSVAFANMTSGNEDELDALSRLEKGLQQLPKEASHSIYKVQRRLRDVCEKAYEPEIVSIGPYHHGKVQCKEMEEVKLRYMQSLLHRKHIELACCMSKVAGIQKKARDCYADDISGINAADFIKMLVLDGCFIIELTRSKPAIHKARIFHSLEWDLILLENQIPFFVLCELFDLIKGPGHHDKLMKRVVDFCGSVFPGKVQYKPGKESKEVKHILDLVYTNWCPPPPPPLPTIITSEPALFIPTASQLKDANVRFKAKEYNIQSRTTTVFAVEFNKGNDVMSMSTLTIEDSTESWLRNLIAYEQYPKHEHTPVTDYALVLDNLINSSKDVQILSDNGIIQNYVSSDQAVVDIVNRLTTKILYSSKTFKYVDTFHHIRTHREKKWNKFMAVYHRDYFNSPWAYVSFFAAVLLLLLTITQTVFAALQQFS